MKVTVRKHPTESTGYTIAFNGINQQRIGTPAKGHYRDCPHMEPQFAVWYECKRNAHQEAKRIRKRLIDENQVTPYGEL